MDIVDEYYQHKLKLLIKEGRALIKYYKNDKIHREKFVQSLKDHFAQQAEEAKKDED